jgi:hypothetical protein
MISDKLSFSTNFSWDTDLSELDMDTIKNFVRLLRLRGKKQTTK